MKKRFIIFSGIIIILFLMSGITSFTQDGKNPPGLALTGGAFWAGTQNGAYAYSWVATYPIHYLNEKEGVHPLPGQVTAQGEFGNTYGPNIRDFIINGASASTVILKGTVRLENIGPWPETSYFEVGLGGSLNSWHQYYYWEPTAFDGSVYVIFQGNSQGGYDIFIQDFAGQSPPSGHVYQTTGTPGDDPVPEAAFHFMAEFDLVNKLAYLTVDGVSVGPVPFGKTIYADWPPPGVSVEENFNVPFGVFAGMVSTDTDNTGRANMSALKVTVK